ncbi:hypothetical protein RHIZ404_190422 [Rhizobium sp. EC-SD404]|nr:hypothetical protein RHIZ404_190422 [Rhizobium sp. EC-SD404]
MGCVLHRLQQGSKRPNQVTGFIMQVQHDGDVDLREGSGWSVRGRFGRALAIKPGFHTPLQGGYRHGIVQCTHPYARAHRHTAHLLQDALIPEPQKNSMIRNMLNKGEFYGKNV